jgi:hypothetical protein
MVEWARELRGFNVTMFISVDITRTDASSFLSLSYLGGTATHIDDKDHTAVADYRSTLEAAGIIVHTYSSLDMELRYPILRTQLVDRLPPVWKRGRLPRNSLAWCFHIEAIGMWWRFVKDSPHLGTFRHVWIMEDDVAVSGSLPSLLKYYDQDPQYRQSDLLTFGYGSVEPWQPSLDLLQSKGWIWSDVVTDQYASLISEGEQRTTIEQVQRFTDRYLNILDELSLAGCTAWSEQSSVSIVDNLPTFQMKQFEKRHFGRVYGFSGVVLSESDFFEITRNHTLSSSSVPLIWHPVK